MIAIVKLQTFRGFVSSSSDYCVRAQRADLQRVEDAVAAVVVWGQLPVDVVPDGVHTRGPGVLRGSEVGSLLLNPSIFGPKPNGQCLAIMFGEGAICMHVSMSVCQLVRLT